MIQGFTVRPSQGRVRPWTAAGHSRNDAAEQLNIDLGYKYLGMTQRRSSDLAENFSSSSTSSPSQQWGTAGVQKGLFLPELLVNQWGTQLTQTSPRFQPRFQQYFDVPAPNVPKDLVTTKRNAFGQCARESSCESKIHLKRSTGFWWEWWVIVALKLCSMIDMINS